ncbi:MAG: hypothetical protein LBH03_06440 [Holophagales bacterium]|jgi:carboxyl-terminal processing protease|nr:hypothetical protein [Holophagales bacterium]
MHKFLRYIISAIVAIACFASAPDGLSPERKKLLIASFEEVWTTVRDRHYDPTLGGLDWQSVHDQFSPRIDKAASDEEGRNIMNEMLGLLKQTHIGVIPSMAYNDMQGESTGNYTPGINIRVLDGQAIVIRLEVNYPAAKAGVAPGWKILKVNGKAVEPILKRIEEHYSTSTLKDLIGSKAIETLLNGQPAEAVEVEFSDGKNTKTLKLNRIEPRGDKVAFGNMPSAHFWVETSSTKDQIRIIKLSMWLSPETVAKAFSEIMADAGNAKGFIIDLRGNPGGIGGMAMGAAGWFTNQTGLKLGTMFMRGATLNFVVSPRPNAVSAPLAILVDGCSASTSEIFAGGMQDLKRARIFGTHTAGAALPSAFVRLPNGDGFQYIMANYISEGGKPLEALGVAPDEIVKPTQKELLSGKDPILDRAIDWINMT